MSGRKPSCLTVLHVVALAPLFAEGLLVQSHVNVSANVSANVTRHLPIVHTFIEEVPATQKKIQVPEVPIMTRMVPAIEKIALDQVVDFPKFPPSFVERDVDVEESVPEIKLAPFYIYPDLEFDTANALSDCEKVKTGWRWELDARNLDYIAVAGVFLSQLSNHPSRTSNPQEATWFIVPWDIDESFWHEGCHGRDEWERMADVLDYLQATPWYQRNQGRDHIWVAMRYNLVIDKPHSFIPATHRHLVSNMVFGRYLSYHLQSGSQTYGFQALPFHINKLTRAVEEWRCTMLLPARAGDDLFVPDQSFDEWIKRKTSIFFRGRHPHPCRAGNEVRNVTIEKLQGVVPHGIIEPNHAPNVDQYKTEIQSSRFCLVMSCDDVQTSRFVDSLAAGCLPVIVADGWDLVAKPYADHINYDTFTIRIPESLWTDDPVGAAKWLYSMPHSKLKKMHQALHKARNALLWNHPKSIVAQMAMLQASDECMPEALNRMPPTPAMYARQAEFKAQGKPGGAPVPVHHMTEDLQKRMPIPQQYAR